MISAIVEGLIYFLLEFVFEAVIEIIAEFGFDSLAKGLSSATGGPVIRGILYAGVGVVLGISSYFILPVHVIDDGLIRLAGSFLSIAGAGFVLCGVSWFVARKDRHEGFWSTSKFIQGVIFGASYSVTRWLVVG